MIENKEENDMSGAYIYLFTLLFIFGIMIWYTGIPLAIYGSIVNPLTFENCNGYIDMNTSVWRCFE